MRLKFDGVGAGAGNCLIKRGHPEASIVGLSDFANDQQPSLSGLCRSEGG